MSGAEPLLLRGAILVEGHPRNISEKLFLNEAIGLGGDVFLSDFYVHVFVDLVAILFSGAEPFKLFWKRVTQN